MSDTAKIILLDFRVYESLLIGCFGALLSSRLALEHWPLRGRLAAERIAFALPIFLLVLLLLDVVSDVDAAFHWSGQFAIGVLCAFGFAFSIQLARFYKHRVVGAALAFIYGSLIYGIIRAWIYCAHHGGMSA